jgi:hypothetical protein
MIHQLLTLMKNNNIPPQNSTVNIYFLLVPFLCFKYFYNESLTF